MRCTSLDLVIAVRSRFGFPIFSRKAMMYGVCDDPKIDDRCFDDPSFIADFKRDLLRRLESGLIEDLRHNRNPVDTGHREN